MRIRASSGRLASDSQSETALGSNTPRVQTRRNNDMRTANAGALLLSAAQEGELETVRQLLESRAASVNTVGERRETPLIKAARGGHLEVVQLLLEVGERAPSHRAPPLTPARSTTQT